MTNLESITNKLLYPSGYAILPTGAKDTPLPMAEWEIQTVDAQGVVVGTGTYYSPQTLSDALGSLLVLEPIIDERFIIMRYGMDWDTVAEVSANLKAMGLTHIREIPNSTKLVSTRDLDPLIFNGSEFMIVPPHQVHDVYAYVSGYVV